jgi:hypothetical protein
VLFVYIKSRLDGCLFFALSFIYLYVRPNPSPTIWFLLLSLALVFCDYPSLAKHDVQSVKLSVVFLFISVIMINFSTSRWFVGSDINEQLLVLY